MRLAVLYSLCMKKYDPSKSLKSQLLDAGAEALDDVVRDEAMQHATAINNDGLSAQIDFLTEQRGHTEESIFEEVFGSSDAEPSEIPDPESFVGMSGEVTPRADDDFSHEFSGECIGVRNGFLQVRDQDDDVFEVEMGQFSPVHR